MSAYGLNIILKKIATRAGVEKNVYTHLLRHSLATHLVMDGWNIVHVREKLRHTNVSVTSIYTHSNPETLQTMTQKIGAELLSKE
jgi:integrase/recombinase XerD